MFSEPFNLKEFKATTYSEWLEEATAQLKGASPEDQLTWSAWEGIELHPYYDGEIARNLAYLGAFAQRAHPWQLLEYLTVEDGQKANEQAMDALNMGAEGVIFDLLSPVELQELIKGIDFSACRVVLIADNLREADRAFISDHGIIFLGPSTETSGGLIDDGSGDPLDRSVALVRNWYNHGVKPFFLLSAGPDFFHELARIRAMRYLINRLAVLGNMNLDPSEVHIHVTPQPSDDRVENWFYHSSIGLAALLGGADSLSFRASEYPRISRNVGNLLREESKLTQAHDYTLGSYFIDYLTDQIIQRLWQKL